MSRITTGIGLATGLDTASIINQLMAIEARPIATLQQRIQTIGGRRTAFATISAQLLGLQNSILRFDQSDFFRRFSARSSREDVLIATASERAVEGTYSLRVHSLVSTHSVLSRGYADADGTPVGQGTISIEIGHGRVNEGTELAALNGGRGVRRGIISITDRSGSTAEIDLSTAQTVEDILNAINSEPGINVRATVTGLTDGDGAGGDRIVIEDLTAEDEVTGRLIVSDVAGGRTADDLGIAGSTAGNRISGRDVLRLAASTLLSYLNDGNGVDRFAQGGAVADLTFTRNGDPLDVFTVSLSDNLQPETDLRALNSGLGVRTGTVRITDRLGRSVEVNLADEARPPVVTVQDVLDRINEASEAAGMSISATTVNSALLISDGTEVDDPDAPAFTIEDVTGFAAADLGIAQSKDTPGSIIGRDVYRVSTVGELINAINYASGNNGRVVAAILQSGKGISLTALEPDSTFTVAGAAGSDAAEDLGLNGAVFNSGLGSFESRRLIGGLNTVLLRTLNGGSGVSPGAISINGTLVDFSARAVPETLQDVIDILNAALGSDPANAIRASINQAGTGISLADQSGAATQIVVSEVNGGTTAAELGLLGTFDGSEAVGANLQRQYVSRATLLADLNLGRGVRPGDVQITDSTGAQHVVTFLAHLQTVGEVIDAINGANPAGQQLFEARINDTGDGILVTDSAGGESALAIADLPGQHTAADLRIAGTAADGQNYIDGTFEIRIEAGPGDTLNDIAGKIAGAGLRASVLNDGGTVNPYSLTIGSPVSGRIGELVIDSRGLDLGLTTMSRARDAIVTMGGADSSNLVLITSPSNTIDGLISGVSLDLLSAADGEVTVSVSQDVDGIVESIQTFVQKYNDVQGAIDTAVRFNSETLERGPLQGDSTITLVRNRMHRLMLQRFEGADAAVSRLSAVGLRLGANNRLEFDEQRFRDVYGETPELVEQLFGAEETGFGALLEDVLDEITRSSDGILAGKDSLLAGQQELLNDRVDRLNLLLEAKRARLEAQFAGLETAIAALQAQQSNLASLFQLTVPVVS